MSEAHFSRYSMRMGVVDQLLRGRPADDVVVYVWSDGNVDVAQRHSDVAPAAPGHAPVIVFWEGAVARVAEHRLPVRRSEPLERAAS